MSEVNRYVYTSADDLRSTLDGCGRRELPVLREALEACKSLGYKTKAGHLRRRIRQIEQAEQYRYRSGEYLAELGDICEFDIGTIRVWGTKRPGRPVEYWDKEQGTTGEVTKLLPGGKLRIRFDEPNYRTGAPTKKTAVRPANQCELSERTM